MARTYSGTPVLSKIKIGSNTYYLKDGDARAILDAINADVYAILQNALGTVAAGGNYLVNAENIKAYVDQIAEVGFDVVVLNSLPTANAQAYADYHNNIVLIADATSTTGSYVEYVILRSGEEGSYTYAWERIGTTQVDLNGYVKNVAYTDATHTLTQTKNNNGVDETTTVHVFGDLADADTASTNYTPAGTISSVTVINDLGEQASFTQGEDTFTQGTDTFAQGTDSFTANVPTALDLTKFNGGSKAADTFSAGSLPSKAADTFSAGSLPSLGTASTDTFAQAGIVANVGTGDDSETLIFTAAATATAVTAQGTFSQGSLPSFTEGAFSAGTLPSFTEGTYTPASLAEGFYTAGTAATYTQGTDTFTQGTDSFVQGEDSFTANVLPTTKTVTPTFTGTTATITVSPDAE